MANQIIGAPFTEAGAGKTGLTVTLSVIAIPKASGSPSLVVNEKVMTEDVNIDGMYWYRVSSVDTANNTYLARAKTAGSVDAQELFGTISTDTDSITAATTLSSTGVAAAVWSYANRTLTQSLVNAAELTSTGTVSFTRGDDEAPQVTVGQITGYQTIWVTAKTSYDDADTAAIIQWKSGTGLVRLNGATTTASWGEIVVESATTGLLTLRLDKEATVDLAPTNGSNLYLDVQIEDADGDIDTVAFGSVSVIADVTRATT